MADLDDIINTLIAEAYGEGPEGMRRVAETILNRSAIRDLTPAEVVRQRRQYTGYEAPGAAAIRAQQNPTARTAAQAAWELAQEPGDPTGGADHYFNPAIVQPGWANSMKPTNTYGGHAFYASRPIPPGEVPEVATLQDTVPPAPPMPVTSSPDMAMMRRAAAPSQLIPETFARLPRPGGNLGDSIGMDPIQGGKQSIPMFDAAYDERVGQMRMTREPVHGSVVGRSPAPAPMPAAPSPHLSAQRATDPVLQAALDARHPAQLPPLPPPSTPSRVASNASNRVRGNSGISTVASIPTTSQPARSASDMARGRSGVPVPDRLAPSAGMPANYGTMSPQQVAQIGAPLSGAVNQQGQRVAVPAPTRSASTAPMPMPASMRPTAVATQLDVMPMPPMPIPRPGIGGPDLAHPSVSGVAPVPMPRLDRPGIFGDVPLPGVFGALNGITKAAANSSGPFKNGYDNLLFQTMNRGNFVAPEGPGAVSRPTGQTFQGTASGRNYEAGRLYSNGNGTFRANPDGSFTNTRSGTISPGSSASSGNGGKPKYDPDTTSWR